MKSLGNCVTSIIMKTANQIYSFLLWWVSDPINPHKSATGSPASWRISAMLWKAKLAIHVYICLSAPQTEHENLLDSPSMLNGFNAV